MRKGHCLCYLGKTAEAEEANGTISIPEVAHDTAEDEYVVCSHCLHYIYPFPYG